MTKVVNKIEDLEGEIWMDIDGYNGKYQISNMGRVKSYKYKTPRILKPGINTAGYKMVVLSINSICKSAMIHRMVATSFCSGYSDGMTVNHIDGVKTNNCSYNLEWVTPKENTRHAIENGLMDNILGSNHYSTNITEKDVEFILINANDYSYDFFCRKFNISKCVVKSILARQNWKRVSVDNYLKKDKRKKILLNIDTGVYYDSIKEAAISSGISLYSLYDMLSGKRVNKSSFIHI